MNGLLWVNKHKQDGLRDLNFMASQIMTGFYVCRTIIYYIYIEIKCKPSSGGDFACSAGELEIDSENWSFQPKAGDLTSMREGVNLLNVVQR